LTIIDGNCASFQPLALTNNETTNWYDQTTQPTNFKTCNSLQVLKRYTNIQCRVDAAD